MIKYGKKKQTKIRILIAAAAVTGVCSTVFLGMSNSVLAAEMNKVEKIPTSYVTQQEAVPSLPAPTNSPEFQADYKIMDETDYYENDKVSDNEITKEEAAQIGMSLISDLYDVDLEDTYVYMGYLSGTETYRRAFWSGDIRMTDAERKPEDIVYTFMIDAVTGELLNASYNRTLKESVSLGFDASLATDDSEYSRAAMDFVKENDLLSSKPVKVEYSSQGYAINDPDICFYVYGEDGERVSILLSRYDRKFKGLITETSLRTTESSMEALYKDVPVVVGKGSSGELGKLTN